MKIRAVQIDIARQMETLDYIKHFIDFTSSSGYNTLVLYLEGRIRTNTFPFMAENESYTPEEMKEVVDYADRKKMDVIPVVSNFAHTEQFLCFKETVRFGELREGRTGRFGNNISTVCPSKEETYEFFENYYREIADIFPSPYFHIGNDEVWDIGFCSLCRNRIKEGETEADIFVKHLKRTYNIVAGKLGKKMMMWDDMFEYYPEALEKIPRDIIMCCWHYDTFIDIPKTHFGNRKRFDPLATYDKLGFKYLIAPREIHPENVITLTEYALNYKPLGGLLTIWEKGTDFMLEDYPNIAFAGKLWERSTVDNPDDLYKGVCKKIFGLTNSAFLDLLFSIKYYGRWHINKFLRGPLTPCEHIRMKLVAFFEKQIKPFEKKVKGSIGKEIFRDILLRLRIERLHLNMRSFFSSICKYISGRKEIHPDILISEGTRILQEIDIVKGIRSAQWKRFRPGIFPVKTDTLYTEIYREIEGILKEIQSGRILRRGVFYIRYFLPDPYGSQKVRIAIKYKGEKKWNDLYSGIPKPDIDDPSQIPYYTFTHFVSGFKVPEKILFQTYGYGGIGITFLEIVNKKGHFIPARTDRTSGKVSNPDALLIDDTRWTYLGEINTVRMYQDHKKGEEIHSIEISLSRV